ncbi:MAG TPA: RibD family protein [Candidatus Limnocylindria bacterium]|nr:RibD family protein [Candidatus Limnocylindria bacterium]
MDSPPRVDRLWPDPAAGLELDAAFADVAPPAAPGRPSVAVNMVTSVDGRAQLNGTADGLSSRADRRLMRLYRAGFDAVGSGSGTLLADDFYSRLPGDLAARRTAAGRAAQPLSVVVAGSRPLPADRRWFGYADQRRVVAVGRSSPHAGERPLSGVETWVAPTDVPEPSWLLERLAAAGVGSLLLEGGPTLNAAFLGAGLLDEVLWTIGSRVVGAEGLPMIAPADLQPVPARLLSVHRHGDELFLRYRLGSA